MTMMAGVMTEGEAHSGYGVRVSGFYCRSGEVSRKLAGIHPEADRLHVMAQAEEVGYVFFIFAESPAHGLRSVRLAHYRSEPHRFFPDLSAFLKRLSVSAVLSISASMSYGSISCVFAYQSLNDNISQDIPVAG